MGKWFCSEKCVEEDKDVLEMEKQRNLKVE